MRNSTITSVGGIAIAMSLACVSCAPHPHVVYRDRVIYEPAPVTAGPPPSYNPPANVAVSPPPASPGAPTGPVAPPPTTPNVGPTTFHDDLAPYGRWIHVAGYGEVWQPLNVAPGWAPYVYGQWQYTNDYGWVWVSDEPFGWATYHYGRWTVIDGRGWVWLPGHEWGPAWVAWRSGGGYTGWAPLPPDRDYGGVGVGVGFEFDFGSIGYDHYHFVEDRYMCDRHVDQHMAPPARNVSIMNVTNNVTKYERVDNHIVNHGVNVAQVEKASGRPVQRYSVADPSELKDGRGRDDQIVMRHAEKAPTADRADQTDTSRDDRLARTDHGQDEDQRDRASDAKRHKKVEKRDD